MRKAAEELKTHRVSIRFFRYDRNSPESFERAGTRALSSRLDGILIAMVLSHYSPDLLNRLSAEIPCIFFDSEIPGSRSISSIVQNSYLSGKLSARLMELLVGNSGSLSVFRILPADHHIHERVRGFRDYYNGRSGFRVTVLDADGNPDTEGFEPVLRRVFRSGSRPHGIFVSNALTFPVARYLESRKLNRHVHVIGYDLISGNVEYLSYGWINFLINQRSELQGYQGIYTLFRHVVLKEKVPEKMMMPLDIITRENVDYVYNSGMVL
jgi:LacI family transcriptional regulator